MINRINSRAFVEMCRAPTLPGALLRSLLVTAVIGWEIAGFSWLKEKCGFSLGAKIISCIQVEQMAEALFIAGCLILHPEATTIAELDRVVRRLFGLYTPGQAMVNNDHPLILPEIRIVRDSQLAS